jgi:uncharacterized protein (TIGR00730 family)
MNKGRAEDTFPSAQEDAVAAELFVPTPQTLSASYRLAYTDVEFLLKDELRSVRLQLELLKPELVLRERGVRDTIIVFGGARILDPEVARARLSLAEEEAAEEPVNSELVRRATAARNDLGNSRYYEEAKRFSFLMSQKRGGAGQAGPVVVTGGGPGIMEAANRGAWEAGAESIGLNIVLPYEQKPNDYITPELCFQFHYFAIRKMHFLMRAKALVVFPGGFGTLDELFETLTLLQTKKIKRIPVLIFGKGFWERVINFDALVEEGVISPDDMALFQYVESADEAAHIISEYLRQPEGV